MGFEIELKEDSPEKLAAVAGKPTKFYLSAPEFMSLVDYINGLDLEQILGVGNSSTLGIEVAGLTIANKINFVTSLITSLRNVSFPDKDGTVAYLDDISALLEGIAWKQPVELLFDTPISQSGAIPQLSSLTNQGVTLANDSRVILMAQANPVFNGIYRVNSTLVSGFYRLYRTNDANTTAELNNAVVGVTSGTHAGKTYRQSTLNPIIGTTAINFVEFGNSTVANATNILAGIAKLYNAIGTETDGGITPKAVNDALALKADLVGGFIPSSQLPAFVDDVLEFANLASFPPTGEIGKIYIAISPKNLQYRWSGSSYIAITNGFIASTNDVPEGTNLYYTDARVNALLAAFKTANFLDFTSSGQSQLNSKSSKIISSTTQVNNIAVSTEQYMQGYPILANTIPDNCVLNLLVKFFKASSGGFTLTCRVYINTTNSLVGATLIAQTTAGGAAVSDASLYRNIIIRGGNLIILGTSSTLNNDLASVLSSTPSTISFDRSVNQFLIVTFTVPNSSINNLNSVNLIKL